MYTLVARCDNGHEKRIGTPGMDRTMAEKIALLISKGRCKTCEAQIRCSLEEGDTLGQAAAAEAQ